MSDTHMTSLYTERHSNIESPQESELPSNAIVHMFNEEHNKVQHHSNIYQHELLSPTDQMTIHGYPLVKRTRKRRAVELSEQIEAKDKGRYSVVMSDSLWARILDWLEFGSMVEAYKRLQRARLEDGRILFTESTTGDETAAEEIKVILARALGVVPSMVINFTSPQYKPYYKKSIDAGWPVPTPNKSVKVIWEHNFFKKMHLIPLHHDFSPLEILLKIQSLKVDNRRKEELNLFAPFPLDPNEYHEANEKRFAALTTLIREVAQVDINHLRQLASKKAGHRNGHSAGGNASSPIPISTTHILPWGDPLVERITILEEKLENSEKRVEKIMRENVELTLRLRSLEQSKLLQERTIEEYRMKVDRVVEFMKEFHYGPF